MARWCERRSSISESSCAKRFWRIEAGVARGAVQNSANVGQPDPGLAVHADLPQALEFTLAVAAVAGPPSARRRLQQADGFVVQNGAAFQTAAPGELGLRSTCGPLNSAVNPAVIDRSSGEERIFCRGWPHKPGAALVQPGRRGSACSYLHTGR